jgi:hypothetical protein
MGHYGRNGGEFEMAGAHQYSGMDASSGTAMAAQGSFVEGESYMTTAARGVVRDHERDPVDGTIRTFGGRDEARLVSALSRVDPSMSNVDEIGGQVQADVSIQAMAATRIRHIESGVGGPTPYEAKDLRGTRGDSTGIEAMGRVELGNVMTGRFDAISSDAAKWIDDTKAFVGREAAGQGRALGNGGRMASTGAFMDRASTGPTERQRQDYEKHGFVPRPSSRGATGSMAAQAMGLGSPKAATASIGPADKGVDLATLAAHRDSGRSGGR